MIPVLIRPVSSETPQLRLSHQAPEVNDNGAAGARVDSFQSSSRVLVPDAQGAVVLTNSSPESGCVPLVEALDSSAPSELARLIKDIYLFPRAGSADTLSHYEVVSQNAERRFNDLLGKEFSRAAGAAGLDGSAFTSGLAQMKELIAQNRYPEIGELSNRLHQQLDALAKTSPGVELGHTRAILDRLDSRNQITRALAEFPRQSADGLLRTSHFYRTPDELTSAIASRGWEVDAQSGLPIADVAIVGAGPGGLSTAYHLGQQGVRTVVFEAGRACQGFSDGGAQAVHNHRTNGVASNMVTSGDLQQDTRLTASMTHQRSLPFDISDSSWSG